MNKKNTQLSQYTPKAFEKKQTDGASYLFSAIIGFAIFMLSFIVLSVLGAIIIYKNPDPNVLVPFVSTISMTVSAIIGGLITAKKSKASRFTASVLFLATVTLAVLIGSVINLKFRESTPFWQSLLLKMPVVLGGFFGSVIGSGRKKQKSLYSKYK